MKQKEIHFHRTTTLTAEQYLAGLTDFGSGRSLTFGSIEPFSNYLDSPRKLIARYQKGDSA